MTIPYVWHPIPGVTGGTYDDNQAGPLLGLHTTEGNSIAGAEAAYAAKHVAPHYTADLAHETVAKHLATTKSASAFKNLPGGVQTNRRGSKVVQVEIVGFAADSPNRSTRELTFLGTFIRQLAVEEGFPLVIPHPFAGRDQAKRFTAREWLTVTGIVGHQHVPENCVTVDTPILGADLIWRPAIDYVAGDEVIGCDEDLVDVGSTGGRRLRRAEVEVNQPFLCESPMMVVTSEGHVVTTPDHPWLVNTPSTQRGTRVSWVQTKDLDPSKHEVYFAAKPWDVDHSHTAGWLAGVLDADGHAQTNRQAGAWVGFGQVYGPLLDRFISEMEARGFLLKQFDRSGRTTGYSATPKPFCDVRVLGGLWEQLRCLGTLRPSRLNLDAAWEGAVVGKTTRRVKIDAVIPTGPRWMAGIQSSSKTYIANGFLMHNTHWDPGALDVQRALALSAPHHPTPPHPTPSPSPPLEDEMFLATNSDNFTWLFEAARRTLIPAEDVDNHKGIPNLGKVSDGYFTRLAKDRVRVQ